MTSRKRLRPVWHFQALSGGGMFIFMLQQLWMADAIGGTEGNISRVMAFLCGAYVVYTLVSTVYFFDIMRSTNAFTKAPLDRFVFDLGTKLAEEGGRFVRRLADTTPIYKYRWAGVFDLDGGLVMHVSSRRRGMVVFIGPVGKDNQQEVGQLIDLVKKAESHD
jgi:hypothetical protein